MKKQEQEQGVRKWYGSDFLDIESSAFELIEGALLGGIDNVVISGCQRVFLSPSSFQYNPGYVIIDGDVCTFNGYNGSQAVIYLIKDSSNVITRPYINFQTLPVARIYEAVVETTQPLSGPYIQLDILTRNRLKIPFFDAVGNLANVEKSNAVNLNDSNTLATSKAVKDLSDSLTAAVNLKADKSEVSIISYKGNFVANQTKILFEDDRIRVWYDAIDQYIKIRNLTANVTTFHVQCFKGSAQNTGVYYTPAAVNTYTLAPTLGNISTYRLDTLGRINFRIQCPIQKTTIFGDVSRSDFNRMSATVYAQ